MREKLQKLINERNSFIIQLENIIEDSGLYFKVQPHRTSRTYIIGFYDKKTLVKIELIIDNVLTLYNSNLIRNYCLYDSRVIIMLNFIKDWSKLKKINGNFNGHLSSYCFTMLVIFFLQKINPKVLPILQFKNFNLFEDIFFYDICLRNNKYDHISIRHLYCNFNKNFFISNNNNKNNNQSNYLSTNINIERIQKMPFNNLRNSGSINSVFKTRNEMSVAELIFNFFKFYLYSFDSRDYCIDIQHKGYVYRFNKYENIYEEKKEFVFIDPIDFDYNPGKYMEQKSLEAKKLRKEFYEALTNILDCKSIIDN